MGKLKNKNGFTMAEVLLVVAIIIILSGVAFVNVQKHQRTLGQLERDGIAKEIFVAAQNHLTVLYGTGYAGVTDFGYVEDATNDVRYFIVSGNFAEDSIEAHMLPYGSIDETVRRGGSFVVRYQKETGLVLDVFYCSQSGSPAAYNHTLVQSEYGTIKDRIDKDGVSNKSWRQNWNGVIVGWYGGNQKELLPTLELKAPEITIYNEEILYVDVKDTNFGAGEIKLIITGVESKAQKAYDLVTPDDPTRTKPQMNIYTYSFILDDVTNSLRHFCIIPADTGSFIPGEDIEIQAVAYSNSSFSNIAYSSIGVTNSLFANINGKDVQVEGSTMAKNTVAYIGNMRHLENLDYVISKLDNNDTGNKLDIKRAQQITNISWPDFCTNVVTKPGVVAAVVTDSTSGGNPTDSGYCKPISPHYSLVYDGTSHSIKGVAVKSGASYSVADAGLFGSISTVTAIKNLELIDFSITGTATAGALAGTTAGCTITNVLAWNSTGSATVNITAPTAGGLIGNMSSGTAQYSAAAVIVSGSSNAGGLIGSAGGSIKSCYSGGHTKNANYNDWVNPGAGNNYDVRGGVAGGLVGSFTGSAIDDSYSTCSVSGSTVGGFVGSAGGSINNSYATGLISSGYAFIGSGSASLSGDNYFSIINEEKKNDGSVEYLLPFAGYDEKTQTSLIEAIDLNLTTYNTFVGVPNDWYYAIPYDPLLVKYFRKESDSIGKYSLKTVRQLDGTLPTGYTDWNQLYVSKHYGDWPAPEILVEN